ncbi:MAG: hypothetical protein OXT69_06115 [Candidatus Poribacteria bacterium]|nr:hypothetical protein [Candidatus Poribacteria bacterium]
MTRKITVPVALAAAALLAAFIWFSLRDAPMLSETTRHMEGAGGAAASMEEAQSPVQPQETSAADGEPSADSGVAELDTGPYKFEGWEDAANHLAELIGLEYDAQIAAGVDPLKAETQAYHDVTGRIFLDEEDPALTAALSQYLPYGDDVPMEERTEERMPMEEFDSAQFLVRAGRLPPLALKKGSLSLPNGERYYFDEDEEVVVIWQTRYVPADTEWGQQELAQLEKEYAQWETKLTHDPENTEALEAIAAIQTLMIEMKTPELRTHRKERRKRSVEEIKRRARERHLQPPSTETKPEDLQPSRPEYKLTVLELGVIDE